MKLDTIFEIQSIIDDKKIPCDIPKILDTEYFSKSKGVHMRLGTMDITHFVRVYNKKVVDDVDIETIHNKIDDVKKKLTEIKHQL